MTAKPAIVAIAGPSGSGKTTLAGELARTLGGTHFHLDDYYRDLSHLPPDERATQNFDHPDQLEQRLLVQQLRTLALGQEIRRPCYDFATHTRVPGRTERVHETHALWIDGIFALHWPEVRSMAALLVYVDAPDALCFERRRRRDIRQRGRSPEQVVEHYAATVRPMAEQFVRPCARWAHVVVDGSASLDWAAEQVLGALRSRGVLPGQVPGAIPPVASDRSHS